jgi:diguanylate cyclase (GGDEF)-like protein
MSSARRDDLEIRIRFGPVTHDLKPQTAPVDCWALRQGRSYLVSNVQRKLVCEHLGGRDGLLDAYACLPLVTQGETLGLLHVSFSEEVLIDAPLDERVEELEGIATAVSLALGNLALRERLKSQSVRDGLTGLYNRRFLEESLPREIERCRRRNLPLTVVMADLDHFKKLNDTWGHEAGDLAIQSFAESARRHFRSEDLLCRYGGEEFCFVLPECPAQDAHARAAALLQSQRESLLRFGRDAIGPVTTSIGIATYPDQAADSSALVRLADAALYRAKLGGRDRMVVHDGSAAA